MARSVTYYWSVSVLDKPLVQDEILRKIRAAWEIDLDVRLTQFAHTEESLWIRLDIGGDYPDPDPELSNIRIPLENDE